MATQGLTPDDVPTRPPLPAQYRDQFARDIAESHIPTSRDDMLVAVDRERLRVGDPPVFQYPEPQVPTNKVLYRSPKSFGMAMFVCNWVAKSHEILIFVCLPKICQTMLRFHKA